MDNYYRDTNTNFWNSLSTMWKIVIGVGIVVLVVIIFSLIGSGNRSSKPSNSIVEITLDRNVVNLKPQDTYQIHAMVSSGNDELKYTSTAPDVVRVSSTGTVTAISKGSSEIVVSSKENAEIFVICYVTVVETTVELTEIEISTKEVEIIEGDRYLINVLPVPTTAVLGTVTYVSANTAVATVDYAGYITGLKEGKTDVIIKTVVDGKQFSTTMKVTVIKAETSSPGNNGNNTANDGNSSNNGGNVDTTIYPSSVSLNINSVEITIGESYQFYAYITPSNTTNKNITWSSSNTSVVSIDSTGKIVGKKIGSTTIVASTSNGKKISANIKVTSPALPAPPDTTLPKITYTTDVGSSLSTYPKGTTFTFICRDSGGIKTFDIVDDTGDKGAVLSSSDTEVKKTIKLVTTGTRKVTLNCTDKAGNVENSSLTVNIDDPTPDTTKPVVTISLSNSEISTSNLSNFYSGAKVSDFAYSKPYPYLTKVTITCTDNKGIGSFSVRDDTGDAGKIETDTPTKKVVNINLAKLGYRTVSASCTDSAGNKATTSAGSTIISGSYTILRNEKHSTCPTTTKACWHK